MSGSYSSAFGEYAFGLNPFGFIFAPSPPSTFGYTPAEEIIPSYLYVEYSDDDNLQAMFMTWNAMAQGYLAWFNDTPLAVWTNSNIVGPLLDWAAEGIYGISRPVLSIFTTQQFGALNSLPLNTAAVNANIVNQSGNATIATDDIYKRVLTWWFYRGDGQQMTTQWIKRRVNRFLNGINGSDVTYPTANNPSIQWSGNICTITVLQSQAAQYLKVLIQDQEVCLPFQYQFVLQFAGSSITGLFDNSGLLCLYSPPDGYPTSNAGLSAGALWSNGGIVSVAGTTTPSAGAPVYYGSIYAPTLLALGGANLPLTQPTPGSSQLWNNGGIVEIA